MECYADDFYDINNYGYDKVHGDGALLLDNWYIGEYGSEKGTFFSTCGRVYSRYTDPMVDALLDDVYDWADNNPYKAYRSYITNVYEQMQNGGENVRIPISGILLVCIVISVIYILTHLKVKEGIKTTVPSTYIPDGAVHFHVREDMLINRYVRTRVIQTSSGSHGGSGGRISSGGVRHGGGSRRR